jgi:hypothetical protein
MKLEKGLLLYITPFYYSDGKTQPQNKFFICLKNDNSGTILLSLPTSQDKIPSYHDVQHGCNDIDTANQCSYCFIAGNVVTDTGFSFEKNTYLFGSDVQDIQESLFLQLYKLEGVDYDIKGRLNHGELNDVLECFQNSKNVKRKIKRLLAE